MLHPGRVAKGLYWGLRQTARLKLGLKKWGPDGSVLHEGVEAAAKRYARVCAFYRDHLDPATEIAGQNVCEIGCGDCLASADMFLNLGAQRVSLIETSPTLIDDVQVAVLERCSRAGGFDGVPRVLTKDRELDKRVTKIPKYLEEISESATYGLMVSFDVLEHVEDLDGFFANCHRMLQPGGRTLHKIDLSGHGVFEDPLPPLDFQTYPDWLYGLMYPKYRRATRNLRDAHLEALRRAGFEIEKVGYLREADPACIEQVRPKLRKEIRGKSVDELKALDWYVKARKPLA